MIKQHHLTLWHSEQHMWLQFTTVQVQLRDIRHVYVDPIDLKTCYYLEATIINYVSCHFN